MKKLIYVSLIIFGLSSWVGCGEDSPCEVQRQCCDQIAVESITSTGARFLCRGFIPTSDDECQAELDALIDFQAENPEVDIPNECRQ